MKNEEKKGETYHIHIHKENKSVKLYLSRTRKISWKFINNVHHEGTEIFIRIHIYVIVLIFVSWGPEILTNWRYSRTSVILPLKLKVIRFSCHEFPRGEYVPITRCTVKQSHVTWSSFRQNQAPRIISRDLSSPNAAMEVRIMWRPSVILLWKLDRAPYHDSWYVSIRLMQW